MTPNEIRRKVKWRDLRHLSRKEKWIENTISLPWLACSLILAYNEFYFLALPFSAIFFLTALRQVHNGFHKALGVSEALTWLTLFIQSGLMMMSIHAVELNHIRHHQFELQAGDYEAKSAHLSGIGAILYGHIHIVILIWVTIKYGNGYYRLNLLVETLLVLGLASLVFYFEISWLVYHVLVMILGEFLTAFFAVWTVHHDTEEHPLLPRTQRKKWKNFITFNMFYHLEHHLFPAVPTIKLPELARRIDNAFPDFRHKQTF